MAIASNSELIGYGDLMTGNDAMNDRDNSVQRESAKWIFRRPKITKPGNTNLNEMDELKERNGDANGRDNSVLVELIEER